MTKHRADIAHFDGVQRTDAGLLDIPARFTRVGVFTYSDGGRTWKELRPAKEVFAEDAMETLKGVSVVVGHPGKVTPENWSIVTKGHVRDDVHQDGKFMAGTARVADLGTIAAVESKKLTELSCGYTCEVVEEPGEFEGEHYDAIQTKIRYNHVGLGPKGWGRAGPEARLVFDGVAVGVSRHDDIAPEPSPGLQMPSQSILEQTNPQIAASKKKPASKKASIGRTPPPGEPADRQLNGAMDIPEMPHAQSTDIGDPYGLGGPSSPEVGPEGNLPGAAAPKRPSKSKAKGEDGGYHTHMDELVEGKQTKMKVAADRVTIKVDADQLITKELESVKGERDALKSRCDGLEKALNEAKDVKRFDGAVQARVDLLLGAAKVLPTEKFDGKSDREVMAAVIAKADSKLSLDGKSDEYVRAVYDTLQTRVDASMADQAKIDAALKQDATHGEDLPSDKSRDQMNTRAQDAWKGI